MRLRVSGGGVARCCLLLGLVLTGCTAGSSGSNSVSGPVCTAAVETPDGMVGDIACVSAAKGGELRLTGSLSGGRLVIPPGALDNDTRVGVFHPSHPTEGVHRLIFEPEGLEFRTPARLTVPIQYLGDGRRPPLQAMQGSAANPVVDVGGEQHSWAPIPGATLDDATREFSGDVQHFSEWYVLFGVQRTAYLVLDIPPTYLHPGDGLWVLTGGEPNWIPGHVAMINSVDPVTGKVTVIESTTGGGPVGNVNGVQINEFVDLKAGSNHVYMGARRPPGALYSDALREKSVLFARSFLGQPYSLFGFSSIKTSGWACTGLLESAWEAADDKGVGGTWDFLMTPVEMYERSVPIDEIELQPYEEFRMPVVPVGIHPDSDPNNPWFGGYYAAGEEFGDVAIYVDGMPDGASFEKDPDTVEHSWTFVWTPQISDIGKQFEITFHMEGTRVDEEGWGWDYDVTERLVLDVRGKVFHWDVYPVWLGSTADRYFAWAKVPEGYLPSPGELIDLGTMDVPVNPVFENQVYQDVWQDYQDETEKDWGCGFRVVRIDSPWEPSPDVPAQKWACWFDLVPRRYTGL